MGFSYVSVDEAIACEGLRMVVVGGIPSPWGEAAKGIFHVKGIEWTAVRLAYDSDALKEWTGERSAPVAMHGSERPHSRWNDILMLAERLAPEPSLLPADAAERALMFGLSHEICGVEGLAWSRRNQLVHFGLTGQGGFPERVARYLAKKYGYRADNPDAASRRVADLLSMLSARLKTQAQAGSSYLVGEALSAADIYCATAMAMFRPLGPELCAMDETTRGVFGASDAATDAALDPILFEHRDMMYQRHLALPLSL